MVHFLLKMLSYEIFFEIVLYPKQPICLILLSAGFCTFCSDRDLAVIITYDVSFFLFTPIGQGSNIKR